MIEDHRRVCLRIDTRGTDVQSCQRLKNYFEKDGNFSDKTKKITTKLKSEIEKTNSDIE